MKITLLGTSSMVPTEERNHSGALLHYKEENILIDCGEGTQRQIRKAGLSAVKITKILITHWHGDHVLGLPKKVIFINIQKKVFLNSFCFILLWKKNKKQKSKQKQKKKYLLKKLKQILQEKMHMQKISKVELFMIKAGLEN